MERVLNDTEMKAAWKKRFKIERKKSYPTQEDFAKAMKEKGHETTKSTVGRWENIGGTYGKEAPGFPSFPAMQTISELLDVQIGYLIGETDGKTFDSQKVSDYLGISIDAVEALRELAAKPGANSSPFSERYGKSTTPYKDTLNKVLTSKNFCRLVDHLNELDCALSDFTERNAPESRNSNACLQEKMHCRNFNLNPQSNPERFDCDGHLVDEDGVRVFNPEDPEMLGEEVIDLRDKTRIMRCLLIDDQMAMARDIWPQVAQLDEGIADLGDIEVRATESSCRITKKALAK